MKEEESISVIMPNRETLPCNNCAYGRVLSPIKNNCAMYDLKPYEVYYESKPCPKFLQSKNKN